MSSIKNSNDVNSKKPSFMRKAAACSLGFGILILALPSTAFALAAVEFAIKELCSLMMGNLGALLMTTAGVGALVAAAMGNFRASYSLLVVGIGAFTISAMLSLYFPKAANMCDDQGMTQLPATGGPMGGLIGGVNPGNVARTRRAPVLSDAEIAIASGKQADFSNAIPVQAENDGEEVDTEDIFDQDYNKIGHEF